MVHQKLIGAQFSTQTFYYPAHIWMSEDKGNH